MFLFTKIYNYYIYYYKIWFPWHTKQTHTPTKTQASLCVCVLLENTYHIPCWHSIGLYGKANFSFQAALSSGEWNTVSSKENSCVGQLKPPFHCRYFSNYITSHFFSRSELCQCSLSRNMLFSISLAPEIKECNFFFLSQYFFVLVLNIKLLLNQRC